MQEKHGRAQVSACVIIIFMNGCRNEVDLILPRAFMFAPLRNVSMFNSLFVGGALRDDTNYSRFSHDVTKIQTEKLSLLLSLYFYVVLQHLKTFTQTNFRFKRVFRFATLGQVA